MIIKVVIHALILSVLFGILIPFLISAPSDVAFFLGVALVVLTLIFYADKLKKFVTKGDK